MFSSVWLKLGILAGSLGIVSTVYFIGYKSGKSSCELSIMKSQIGLNQQAQSKIVSKSLIDYKEYRDNVSTQNKKYRKEYLNVLKFLSTNDSSCIC